MNDSTPIVHLIHGYIAAGKTTFAKKLEKETNAVRFSIDEWICQFFGEDPPAEDFSRCYALTDEWIERMWIDLIKKETSVILDLGFWSREKRDKVREIIKSLNAHSKCRVPPNRHRVIPSNWPPVFS